MTIYVSELPESCSECEFNWCSRCKLTPDLIYRNCPIQSLSDYTKQVRKEVCDRIQSKIEEKARYSTNNNDGWDILIDENLFLEILDQIQGEEDG